MSDLISRKDVIELLNSRVLSSKGIFGDLGGAVSGVRELIKAMPSAEEEVFEWCHDCKEYDQKKHCCHRWTKVIRQTIEEMKAESEQKRTFLEIDVSYPPICTYPEYEGKPYYAIKYLEDGEIIVGFGTYKPDVLSEYLRKYFIQSADTERTVKPKKGAYDLIRCDCGMPVSSNYYYCPKCKAKLEWSDDE